MSVLSDRAVLIKKTVPLEDYLRNVEHLTLKPEGAGFKALCPFHNDKNTPNLLVDAKPREHYTCFACNKSGDVIRWVMDRKGVNFVEAMDELAVHANLPPLSLTPEQRTAYGEKNRHHKVLDKVNRAFLAWATIETGKSTHLPIFQDYLGKRGISLKTATAYGLVYADASVTTVRQALIDQGISAAEIDESMILANPSLFQKRLIVGVKNNTLMRLLYGRSVDGSEPHHLYQSGSDKILFNLDRVATADKVILVESILDALSLVELGFDTQVVGALGAGLTAGQVEDLKRTGKKIWILYDTDTAGARNALDVGLKLGGHRHAIAKLKGSVKDPNDFLLKGGTKSEIEQILEESKGQAATDLLITSIDKSTPRHELPKVVEPVLKHLAQLEDAEAKAWLTGTFKDHFTLKAGDLAPYRDKIERYRRKAQAEREAEERASRSDTPDLPENETDIGELHNGVSYVDGRLWYQFLVPRSEKRIDPKTHREEMVKVVDVWYVCSDRTFRRRDAQKIEDELVIDKTPISIRPGRWATAANSKNSINAWKTKKEDIDPVALYSRIRELLDQYLWMPDERYLDVLATWTVMTYWTPVFDTVGYLYLHASPRSGKTTTMNMLAHMAFEGELMGDVSGSALFRKIEGSRGAMLLDEMEKLANEEYSQSADSALQVLLTGYKSNGTTQRTDLDTKTDTNSGVVTFSTFSPKIIANTKGLHVPTIRDRSIELMLLRSNKRLPQFNERKHEKSGTFKAIRNDLYTMGLKYVDEIGEWYEERFETEYEDKIEKRGLFGRDYEVWIGLWCVSAWLTEKGVPGLIDRMIDLAEIHKNSRDASMAEEGIDAPILKALRRFVKEHGKSAGEITYKGQGEWYAKQNIMNYLKKYPKLNKVSEGRLLEVLKRLHIIEGPQGPTTTFGKVSVEILPIRKKAVEDAIKRYDIGPDDPLMLDESIEDLSIQIDDEDAKKLADRWQ